MTITSRWWYLACSYIMFWIIFFHINKSHWTVKNYVCRSQSILMNFCSNFANSAQRRILLVSTSFLHLKMSCWSQNRKQKRGTWFPILDHLCPLLSCFKQQELIFFGLLLFLSEITEDEAKIFLVKAEQKWGVYFRTWDFGRSVIKLLTCCFQSTDGEALV